MESIPNIGLGTWLSPSDATTIEAVRYAIEEAGYRHVDCAAAYGNEEAVGVAIKDVLTRNVVKREELWITSKLWCQNFSPEEVETACRDTLKKLQLEYIDLYLIHWPIGIEKNSETYFPMRSENEIAAVPNNILDTYRAMEKLVDLNLVRHIGVCNFPIAMLEKIRFAPGIRIQPYANQVEFHLYMQNEALIRYCDFRGIVVTGWGCLGRGTSGSIRTLEDPVLLEVANELGKPAANVHLRFLQQLCPRGSVLAKSVTKERIMSNKQLDFSLSDEQMEKLKKRERCLRLTNRRTKWGIDIFGDCW